MLIRATNCAVILAAVGFSALSAGDWPTYQQNNARVAASDETLGTPLALRWTYTSPATPQTAWSGPRDTPIEGLIMRHRVRYDDAIHVVSAAGKTYFGSPVDHQMHCVDAATGKPLWSYFTEGPIRLAPTLADGRVYCGSDDGNVYCLNADDGKRHWKFHPAPRDER